MSFNTKVPRLYIVKLDKIKRLEGFHFLNNYKGDFWVKSTLSTIGGV